MDHIFLFIDLFKFYLCVCWGGGRDVCSQKPSEDVRLPGGGVTDRVFKILNYWAISPCPSCLLREIRLFVYDCKMFILFSSWKMSPLQFMDSLIHLRLPESTVTWFIINRNWNQLILSKDCSRKTKKYCFSYRSGFLVRTIPCTLHLWPRSPAVLFLTIIMFPRNYPLKAT